MFAPTMPLAGPELHGEGGRFIVLLLALLLDAVVGDMAPLFRTIPHPVVLMGRAIALADRRLNRADRVRRTLRERGIFVVIVLVAGVAAVGWLAIEVARSIPYGWALEVALVVVFVAQRSLFDHVRVVERALRAGDLVGGRVAVRHIVGRDPRSLDKHGVARAALESLAENFTDGVVAPVFWYLLLGLPGLMAYKCANTLDSMIGHRTERYAEFGWAAARFDDALNYLPARLAAILMALAALFVPRCRADRALRIMLRDAGKHRSVNAGWPEAAMAGAIGVALAGPRRYGEMAVNDPWLGEDLPARAQAADIRRGLAVFVVACLIHAALIAILLAVWLTG